MRFDRASRSGVSEPRTVRTIGWVYVALGIVDLVSAPLIGSLSLILLIAGALQVLVGWGLVTGRVWAYLMALALAGLNTLMGLLSLAQGATGVLTPLLVNGLVLVFLLRGDVRRWAGLGRST